MTALPYRPQNQMFAKVILASMPTNGAPPIFTMHWRYPRIIHGEVMTHRVFSRNARSSRAVPVAKMLEEIRNTPFVPWHWGKNQKGMQGGAELNEPVEVPDIDCWEDVIEVRRETAWLEARNRAVEVALGFDEAGYHKQIVNRLTEPFSWIDTLVTSTQWANFLHLRDHKDAEPHFRDLAQMVKEALAGAEMQTLEPGEWHLPWVKPQEERELGCPHKARKISVARSARISYAPFDGDPSVEKELQRYELLVGSDPLHASPAEHQATPDAGNINLGGNLGPGWIQFRKTLKNEFVSG